MLNSDTGKYVMFINSRDFAPVAEALKRFTNVETASRDGSSAYAKILRSTFPNAEQISDRFHLIKNLTDTAERNLSRIIPFAIVPQCPEVSILGTIGKMTSLEKQKFETYQKKLQMFDAVKALQNEGKNATAVSKQLGYSESIVRKYFDIETLSPQGQAMAQRDSMLNEYKSQILEMVRQKFRTGEIVKAVREKGCKCADSRIRGYISKVRRDGADFTEAKFYRRDILKLLYYPIEELKDEKLREKVLKYITENPNVKTILDIVVDFKVMLKSKSVDELEAWNKRVKALKIRELTLFVNRIESDFDAIKNAVLYDYSNGVAEGKINKLKTIKRQIYGKASYELLTSRLFLSDQF